MMEPHKPVIPGQLPFSSHQQGMPSGTTIIWYSADLWVLKLKEGLQVDF